MRVWLLILAILTEGCHRAPNQPNDVLYQSAEDALRRADSKQALAQADAGLKKCGFSSEWCWEFRLLKAEVLVSGQPEAALKLLDVPGKPPRMDLEARRRIQQGWAWYRLADYPKADQALREAQALAESCADRKSTRLNSSHLGISYAVFCLK